MATNSKQNLKTHIFVKGASLHNLKNIDVSLPKHKLVIITGLSGSGKSSFAFDTLYAEGQRRYVESLSSYARQFLGKLEKPKVEKIEGLTPTIAIEQKVNTTNPRSTVGTSTEIYNYLKLLFARIGKTYDPITKEKVKKHTVEDVIIHIKTIAEKSKVLVLAPLYFNDVRSENLIKMLASQGYARLFIENTIYRIDKNLWVKYNAKQLNQLLKEKKIYLIVERLIVKNESSFYENLPDCIETAFFEGKGYCVIFNLENNTQKGFSNLFESNGRIFTIPTPHFFNFNNPYGACPDCEGYGSTIGVAKKLVIPDTSKSIYEEAIVVWATKSTLKYKEKLINNAYKYDISIHKPWFELDKKAKESIWKGTKDFMGINDFFKKIEKKSYKVQNRVLLSRYRGKSTCSTCEGTRLKKETHFIKIHDKSITDLVQMPVNQLAMFFENLQLSPTDFQMTKRLLAEIKNRLSFLSQVGLGYLTLNRNSNTLSGGEMQRINLSTCLGSSLVGSTYILDEPSVGLHPQDTKKLINILKKLRDLGNTVIVIEHDIDLMEAADYIVDIGPKAGSLGGKIVAQGPYKDFVKQGSITADYLNQKRSIKRNFRKPLYQKYIEVIGARAYNLKNINVKFYLNTLNVITGVSGSGKSTLVKKILYPALQQYFKNSNEKTPDVTGLKGDLNTLDNVLFIDQNPIGRSSRSNPITYIKAYDNIRILYSKQKKSILEKLQPKHFSFNVEAGRCRVCKGEGRIIIPMQFMADVYLTCEVCKGKMFQKNILDITFQGKNIYDVLQMTVDDAIAFFENHNQIKISQLLLPLQKVGLGYMKLGQSCTTLSGGEAQRLKLASFLTETHREEKNFFIFDEPTTGLHFYDVQKLLNAFDELLEKGHSILVVEHNVNVIKNADRIIDLGEEGGEKGGHLLFEGTAKDITKSKKSITGRYINDL